MSRHFATLYAEAEADLAAVLRAMDEDKHAASDIMRMHRDAFSRDQRIASLQSRVRQLEGLLNASYDRQNELIRELVQLKARRLQPSVAELREQIRVQEIELQGLRKMTYPVGHSIILANQRRSA